MVYNEVLNSVLSLKQSTWRFVMDQKKNYVSHINLSNAKLWLKLWGKKTLLPFEKFHFCAGPFWDIELLPSPQDKLKAMEQLKADCTPRPLEEAKDYRTPL